MIWATVGVEGCAGSAVRVRPAIARPAVSTVAASTAASAKSSWRLGRALTGPAGDPADAPTLGALTAFPMGTPFRAFRT